MDETMRAKLQRIIDKNDILECLVRYCRGMDRRDLELMRSAFHTDGVDLHSSVACTIDGFQEWVWPYHAEQKLHQHCLYNHTVEIDGDVAHSEIYYSFVATYPEPSKRLYSAGGRYVDRLERRNGEWRISARICVAEWTKDEETDVIVKTPINTKDLVEDYVANRSREDVSYVRPLTATLAKK